MEAPLHPLLARLVFPWLRLNPDFGLAMFDAYHFDFDLALFCNIREGLNSHPKCLQRKPQRLYQKRM